MRFLCLSVVDWFQREFIVVTHLLSWDRRMNMQYTQKEKMICFVCHRNCVNMFDDSHKFFVFLIKLKLLCL